MKKNKGGIIYKVISPSGKIYFGQTICKLEKRKREHVAAANNPNSQNYKTKFAAAIRKYQKQLKWVVVDNNVPYEKMDLLERKYIEEHDTYRSGYNSTPGGNGAGRVVSDETKRKLSEINKGKTIPKDIRDKISASLKGKMAGEKNPMYGIKQPEAQIKKKSHAWVAFSSCGKRHDFYNLRKFCRDNNLAQSHMLDSANGKTRHHKGWICFRREEYSDELYLIRKKSIENSRVIYELISPDNKKYITDNLRQFCIKYDLNNTCLINVAKGDRKHHKNWKATKLGEEKMKKIRGPMLGNRKAAEKDMKQKMALFDELGDECLVCNKDFDKTDIKEVSTWRVVVSGEKVSTYCPDCWKTAEETIRDFKERVETREV